MDDQDSDTPQKKAHKNGRWAETMFRALTARYKERWTFVSFRGKGGGESRGVVDILAVRRNTKPATIEGLKSHDLFDLKLVQLKGGKSRAPSRSDIDRLRIVAEHYGALSVVLYEWEQGKKSAYKELAPEDYKWIETTADAVFGRLPAKKKSGASSKQ